MHITSSCICMSQIGKPQIPTVVHTQKFIFISSFDGIAPLKYPSTKLKVHIHLLF